MTSTDIAIRGENVSTALTIRPDQDEFTSIQLAALRSLGLEDAPEGEIRLFFHVCKATGLDPFRKQIYMIGRKTKVSHWDRNERKNVDEWVMKYTIQTGIDGFRKNGRDAAKRTGDAIRLDGPYWQGPDGGGWQDVWLANSPPAAAKFTIFRDGEPFTGIAMYREFMQTAPGNSGNPNSMWAKMPANQLAKCAEAQAWRRAYPDDFSGVVLEDAVQVIDAEPVDAKPTAKRKPGKGVAGLRDQLGVTTAPTPTPEPEVVEAHADASDSSTKPEAAAAEDDERGPRLRKLTAILAGKGLRDEQPRLALAGHILGRDLSSLDELTTDDIEALLTAVTAMTTDDARAIVIDTEEPQQK
ncbi:recombinase RecT [Nocardia otitidiscaviarum]|uniref:RecT family recombinase n=1 Tax=Nocardia otitidiscaviarum TaxID=1823 RepID=UPI001895976C|nr:RecT family recombinase [Nocardia otitidiscaviarum]MBF6138079.1 recombinase RecT [Nocardia otitidiscaviarum]